MRVLKCKNVCFILLVLVLFIVSFLGVVFSYILYSGYKSYEKYKLNKPYDFDIYEEYKIHQKVGSKDSQYKKYDEWKSYILEKYDSQCAEDNINNFSRYLNRVLNSYEDSYDVIIHIIVPSIVALYTILITINLGNGLSENALIFEVVMMAGISMPIFIKELLDAKKHIAFIKDFLEVISEKKK